MENSLSPDVRAFLDLLAAGPRLSFRDMGVAEARAAVRQMGAAFDTPADLSVTAQDAMFGAPAGPLRLRCYTPPEARAEGPAILFLHGGGWVVGGIDEYDGFCRFLARRSGLRVTSLDYRLAPESPFPGAFDDALAAANWLASGESPLGAVNGLVLAGDSAGGGIAAALAGSATGLAPGLRALLLFYPVLDISRRAPSYRAFAQDFLLQADDMDWFIDCYVPDAGNRTDPRCSPLLAGAAGLPPVALMTCSHDVLRDEGRAYAEACRAAGVRLHHVEAAGHIHGLVTLRQAIPSGVPLLGRLIDGLNDLLK